MPPDSLPRVVALCYFVEGTGLSRVMQTITNRLQSRYEIHYVGLGYQGDFIDGAVKVYPTNREGGDVYGAFQAKTLVNELRPAIVLILHDLWYFGHYVNVLKPVCGDQTRLVGYIPIDGYLPDEQWVAPLASLDRVVAYTEFGRRELQRAFERARGASSAKFPPIDVIPHGTDTDCFHPLPELEAKGFRHEARVHAKKTVFPDVPQPEDSFIVLNASRPAARKRLDLTIEGFAEFAQGKPPNVRLCFHQAITGAKEAEEIRTRAQRVGIADRLHFNPFGGKDGPVSDDRLNFLYNACDVGVNTSLGEGWGLVSFEHAAAGGAQIVPRHSACEELWEGCAELLEPVERFVPRFTLLEMQAVSARGLSEALERLYSDREFLRERSSAGHRNACRPDYQWQTIADQWDRLFQEVTTHG